MRIFWPLFSSTTSEPAVQSADTRLGLDSNLFSVRLLQLHSDSSPLPICPDCPAVGANEVVKKRCTVSSGWMLRCALARMRAPSSAASSTDACSSAVDLGLPNLIKVSRTESCH